MQTFRAQVGALQHAEAVLLVDDGESETLKLDILFEQRMRADGDLGIIAPRAYLREGGI